MTIKCPCQSGQLYSECCQPYHLQHQFPEKAEQLMRSRYTAYTLKNIDYIVQTTVPQQQALLNTSALQQWAEQTTWLGLQILSQQTLSKQHSAVEFNAFFAAENSEEAHHERSLFVRIDQRWYFLDPTIPLPTMKQACLCGSGKKFKHCCGGYL